MRIRNYLAVGALVVSVGTVSGCGGGTPAEQTSTDQYTVTPVDTPDAEETTPAANQADVAEVTAPGTVLAVGDDAIVDYRIMTFPDGLDKDGVVSPSGDLMMRVSVTSVTNASVEDLPDDTIISGATEDELSVVQVTYEVQAIGTPAISMERRGISSDFDPDGWNAYTFSDSQGEIVGCINPVNLGTAFDGGETVAGCFLLLYVTSEGLPNLTFKPANTDLYDNPLVWSLS